MPADPTNPADPAVPEAIVDLLVPLRTGPVPTRRWDRLAARRHDPRAVAIALAVVAGVAAVVWLRLGTPHGGPNRALSEPALARVDRRAVASSPTAAGRLVVAQVAGAVATPGLVRVRDGDRVADAIEAAGGARPDADLDAVNLAARVADGERIVVPVRGAVAATSQVGGGGGTAPVSTGPVHLNSATVAELDALPGIGPSLAAAIIRAREERGGFGSVRELEQVRGIGEARMADLTPLVAL